MENKKDENIDSKAQELNHIKEKVTKSQKLNIPGLIKILIIVMYIKINQK